MEQDTTPIDDNSILHNFSGMSLAMNNELSFSSYALSAINEINNIMIPDTIPTALASITSQFNSALDSGCTNHIIYNRELFWTYDTAAAVPVKTANCGILTTYAKGDVKFHIKVNGYTITWTLHNCLHAPDVPINLISVGALQERDLTVTFSKFKTTISFPNTHPQLKGASIEAKIINRLSFLNC